MCKKLSDIFSKCSKIQRICVIIVVVIILCAIGVAAGLIIRSKIVSPKSKNDKINQTSGLQPESSTTPHQTTPITKLKSCPLSNYTFRSPFDANSMSQYPLPVPKLLGATVCMWVKASQDRTNFVIFSYSATEKDMLVEFKIEYRLLESSMFVRIHSTGWLLSYGLVNIDNMTHICVWFDSRSRGLGAFINGQALPTSYYSGEAIPGGGNVYLGRQNTGFESPPEWNITWIIENAAMWPRVLNQSEITNLRRDCVCPTGRVFSTSIDDMELHGDVIHKIPVACHTAD